MAEANLSREEARERASLISDLDYEVSLDLTTGAETFECETVIKFRCSEPGAATFLDYSGAEVNEVTLNGAKLPATGFTGTRLDLERLDSTNELKVIAKSSYQHTGVGMHRFVDPADDRVYMYSDLEPFECHRIFPCFDQPDLKATFRFAVNALADSTVLSNMPVRNRPPENEAGWWSFEVTPKISTYITAVVAGPYHSVYTEHDGFPLGLHCRRSLAEYLDPEEWFEITAQGFDYYHKVFEYRCPFPKYDQVVVPEFNSGAMENAGCITFNEVYVYRGKVTDATRERRAEVILHEMAHMWFGDLVTMRWWDDLWLNESFATYMAQVAQDATRFTEGWVSFANDVKATARSQDQLPTTHPIAADIPDTLSTRVMFDAISYSKGASVLRQLVAWVGEDAFFDGIRAYFRRHEFGNTDLSDFLGALEESSGRDLHGWSKEWLQTSGVNTIGAEFSTDDSAFSSFSVVQEAAPEFPTLRSHRLAIGLYDSTPQGVIRRKRVELDVEGRSTNVPELVGEKIPDLLLLNDDDLTYAKARLDQRSFDTIKERLREVKDPVARALGWSAAWDMLVDGDLSATAYMSLVKNNLEGESQLSVLRSLLDVARSTLSGIVVVLLGKLRAVVEVYGNPARSQRALKDLSRFLQEIARRAEPGSDHQLQFVRGFIPTARSVEEIQLLRGLLDGSSSLEGLAIDTDLRWLIVRSLAALGEADESLISSELERDPTDEGTRHALRARASHPSSAAKAEAWEAIVDDTSLSRTSMVALMGGMQQPGQEEVLRPYGEKFFDALGPIWSTRSIEVSQAFAQYAFPLFILEASTVAMTNRYLESEDPAPPLRRLLIEGREGITRALRTRAIDAAS